MNIRQVLRPGLQQQAAAAERRPQKKAASPIPKRTDHTAWSQQALALINEQNRRVWEKKPEDKTASSHLKQLEKELKTQDKCMKIFARISSGDKVPPEDRAYLANIDPSGYLLALAQRHEKPDPKEWESVLEEGDLEESYAVAAAGGGAGAGASACAETTPVNTAPV